MAKLKFYNFRLLLTKCLLASILFFSFIAIAGYNTSSISNFRQNCQTELVYSKVKNIVNQTVLYQNLFLPTKQTAFHSRHTALIFLLIYQELIKAKFKSLSKEIYSFSNSNKSFPIKNIPKNSKEDYFTSSTS